MCYLLKITLHTNSCTGFLYSALIHTFVCTEDVDIVISQHFPRNVALYVAYNIDGREENFWPVQVLFAIKMFNNVLLYPLFVWFAYEDQSQIKWLNSLRFNVSLTFWVNHDSGLVLIQGFCSFHQFYFI